MNGHFVEPSREGHSLGHFSVLEKIGAGMGGVVYRARDTRLGREVALKVLLDEVSHDADRLFRFKQEARILATVNHPSIEAIYESLEEGGSHFLVLELVPGETLAERLLRGPMQVPEALDVIKQIASALDAAHARGIVHRDLKPANVKLTPEGRVKVLDFGLAMEQRKTVAQSEETLSLDSFDNPAGGIVGTPLYLCPEQARGQAVDARCDLWAVGCIFYEVLTGAPPFQGSTVMDVIAAVLERAPDLDRLPAGTPSGVRELIRTCLEKSVEQRPVTAQAVLHAVEAMVAELAGSSRVMLAAPLRFTQVTFAVGVESSPSWSPDGKELVYTREVRGVRHLFRQDVSGRSSTPVTQGECDDIMPDWSPDGRSIAFVRARDRGRMIEPGDVFGRFDANADVWSIDLTTGREERLVENAFHPAFSPDGTRIAADATWAGPSRIWIIDRNGRNPRQVSTDVSEAVEHIRPRWSPDGMRIVFQNIERTKLDIRVVRLRDGVMTWTTNDLLIDFAPTWSRDGRFILFSSAYRAGGINIWRVPVGTEGEATGPPLAVTTGAGQDIDPRVSPDGSRLAFAVLRQNADIWRLPVDPMTGRAAGAPEPLIGGTREESRGAWSPDGSCIAFNSDRSGDMNLWIRSLMDGTEKQITSGHGGDYQANWSPDGRTLVFFSSRSGRVDIWSVDVESGTLVQLSRGESLNVNPCYSPDGSRIAYQSDLDGRLEVWIMNADGGVPRQVTRVGVGGHFLRWTPDSHHVVFRCPGLRRVMRVSVDGGEPEPLPEVQGGAHISLSPDGSRIMDVVAHKALWVSPLEGGTPESVFQFPEPEARIDYPSWSPNGRHVLFDRFQPQGGDIWVADGL